MEIIDIHAHIFQKVAGITKGAPMTSLKDGKVKIGNNISQFMPPSFENTNSRVETLIAYMDWCGISKALLMPNPYYGYHNDYFLEAIERYPDRLRGVALVDLLKGEQAARELETLYEKTPLFGFKVETDSTFQCAPDKHLADPEFNPVWDLCSQCRQPVFLHLFTDSDYLSCFGTSMLLHFYSEWMARKQKTPATVFWEQTVVLRLVVIPGIMSDF